jgi:O-antigen/teichoic acid export membrane protein
VKGRTARAAGWAFLATAGTRLITLISLTVLARLLAPAEFGLLAFALVYITYAETIGDLGTAVALIYWKDRREDAAQVTFLINAAMGALWCIVTILLAPVIADFFNNAAAAPIVRTLAFGFLIKFLGNTHDALAQKDLRFRARAIPEVGMAATKAGVSIALAAAGLGAWSLVWGQLSGQLVWTVAAWIVVRWRPSFRIPRGLFGPMLRYGRGIVGVNMIAAVVHHADLAIVGRMLGTTALGLYQLAYKIPEATIIVITWVASRVLFPAFSRIPEGRELRDAYLQALTYVSLISVPMAAGLFVIAEPLVRVFFGDNWLAAAPILRWLAVYAGIRSISTHGGDVLKATGRSSILAAAALLKAAVILPALIFGARYSAEGVAMALAAATAATAAVDISIVRSILKFRLRHIAGALRPSLLAGAVMVAVTLWLERVSGALRPEVALAAIVVTGALAYSMALFVFDRRLFAEVVSNLPRRRREAPL